MRRFVPPKKLYRYNIQHELVKFDVDKLMGDRKPTMHLNVDIVEEAPAGTLYRVRCDMFDVYGWDKLQAARNEEVSALCVHISELTAKLNKIRGKRA